MVRALLLVIGSLAAAEALVLGARPQLATAAPRAAAAQMQLFGKKKTAEEILEEKVRAAAAPQTHWASDPLRGRRVATSAGLLAR